MLTVEKLRKDAQEALDNGEWLCLVSGEIFTITKINCQQDIEELVENMIDTNIGEREEENLAICDNTDDTVYTDADHAKDWNYFKNTMVI